PLVVHPDADAVAGNARLRDLEDRAADPVPVADADLVVGKTLDREVLPELAVDEIVPTKLVFPVAVGVDLVDEDGALLAAVAGAIALTVALDVQRADVPRAGDGVFVDARDDRLPLPGHLLRHADVDRKQGADRPRRHAYASVKTGSSMSSMPPISSTLR